MPHWEHNNTDRRMFVVQHHHRDREEMGLLPHPAPGCEHYHHQYLPCIATTLPHYNLADLLPFPDQWYKWQFLLRQPIHWHLLNKLTPPGPLHHGHNPTHHKAGYYSLPRSTQVGILYHLHEMVHNAGGWGLHQCTTVYPTSGWDWERSDRLRRSHRYNRLAPGC